MNARAPNIGLGVPSRALDCLSACSASPTSLSTEIQSISGVSEKFCRKKGMVYKGVCVAVSSEFIRLLF